MAATASPVTREMAHAELPSPASPQVDAPDDARPREDGAGSSSPRADKAETPQAQGPLSETVTGRASMDTIVDSLPRSSTETVVARSSGDTVVPVNSDCDLQKELGGTDDVLLDVPESPAGSTRDRAQPANDPPTPLVLAHSPPVERATDEAAETVAGAPASNGSLDYSTPLALLVPVDVQAGDPDHVVGFANGLSAESRARHERFCAPVFEAVGNCDLDQLEAWSAMDPLFIRKSYDWGWTLGHVAAATGMFEVLEWIADLDVRSLGRTNDYGMTPMHYAAANGQYDALETLVLVSKFSANKACNRGMRPVDLARKGRCRKLLLKVDWDMQTAKARTQTAQAASPRGKPSTPKSSAAGHSHKEEVSCACFPSFWMRSSGAKDACAPASDQDGRRHAGGGGGGEQGEGRSSARVSSHLSANSPGLQPVDEDAEEAGTATDEGLAVGLSRARMPSFRERIPSLHHHVAPHAHDGGRDHFMAGGRERFHSGRGSMPADTIFGASQKQLLEHLVSAHSHESRS